MALRARSYGDQLDELYAVQARIGELVDDIARLERTEAEALNDAAAGERSSPSRIRAMAARDQIEAERIELDKLRHQEATLQQMASTGPESGRLEAREPSPAATSMLLSIARLALRLAPNWRNTREAIRHPSARLALRRSLPRTRVSLARPSYRLSITTVFVTIGAIALTLELGTLAGVGPGSASPGRPGRAAGGSEQLRRTLPALPEPTDPRQPVDKLSVAFPESPGVSTMGMPEVPAVPDLSRISQRLGIEAPPPQLPSAARAYRAQFGHGMDEDLPEYEANIQAWLLEWRAAYKRGEPWATGLAAR